MNVFFDLDGTLIDVRSRLYKLFCDLIAPQQISFSDYWRIKRRGVSNVDILQSEFGYTVPETELFVQRWMEQIETARYLKLDTIFAQSIPTLMRLTHCQCFIVTARQHYDVAHQQVADLRLLQHIAGLLVTSQKMSKVHLIESMGLTLSSDDVLVGDTGTDINAGKTLGIRTVAVTSGVLSKSTLKAYKPDHIAEDVGRIPDLL